MKNVIYLSIIGFLLIFIIQSECGKSVQNGEEIKLNGKKYELIKIDTVYKEHTITKYKRGEDIFHDTTIYVEIPKQSFVDTQSILKNYYAKNVFTDTFKTDFGNVIVKDTIQKNLIYSRNYHAYFKTPEITRYVKDKPKYQVFIGAKGTIQNSSVNAIGTGLMLKTKRDRMYGIGAIVDKQKNVNFTIDFYTKL